MIRVLIVISFALLSGMALAEEQKEGGIIGTGVIGQVTGVEEFEVSGMRFGLAPDVVLKDIASVSDIELGMTLVATTAQDGNAWEITELQRVPVLVGPVTGPNEVLGVSVEGAFPDAEWVIVDGFWTNEGVVATRISPTETGEVRITGMADPAGFVGNALVDPTAVASFPKGSVVTATGQYAQGAVSIDNVTAGTFMQETPDLLLLEGFYQSMDGSDEFTLQGVGRTSAASVSSSGLQPVRRCAVGGRLDFVESDLSPEDIAMIASFCVSVSG